ncbi:division/cell wall cluster transcriptional repressor MraZ [Patescibacteria group bacterium]|nr:division/cell wall cluster transcriptional repressor MraZ [Patescibacteria group bacterium]MBU1966872.1 division/cell wall cluster transcriptional repressor MraZ [Patescibacteria group bacterium]MBU2543511.1 division/cell wall cluster transcriptional repressor MraZ [Patescibacteria group bacterium]
MFIGRYYHTLEENRRLSLPKNFRKIETNWIITRGLDGGLFLFRAVNFKEELKKLSQRTFTKKAHRDFIRLMANDAKELLADDNGRVSLPEYLTEFAKLKKQVVIVGSYSKVEIWDRDQYHHYLEKIQAQAEKIAEGLNDQD